MLKLGTQVGNLQSYLMQTPKATAQVGDAATIILWTDRYAGTVVKVTSCQIHVQRDKATRIDSRGPCDSQDYEYSPDPKGEIYVFRMTKKGWNCKGFGLSLGHRDEHYDYGF